MFGQRIIKDAVADPLVHIADTVVLMNGKNKFSKGLMFLIHQLFGVIGSMS